MLSKNRTCYQRNLRPQVLACVPRQIQGAGIDGAPRGSFQESGEFCFRCQYSGDIPCQDIFAEDRDGRGPW